MLFSNLIHTAIDTILLFVPFIIFVALQDKVNKYFETGLLKATKSNWLLIRFAAFAGIWIHNVTLKVFGKLMGFKIDKKNSNNFQIVNVNDNNSRSNDLGYNTMGFVRLIAPEANSTNYGYGVFAKLRKVNFEIVCMINHLFTAVPYIASIVVTAIVSFGLVVSQMAPLARPYFINGGLQMTFVASLPTMIKNLVLVLQQLVLNPAAWLGLLACGFFMSFGLSYSKIDLEQLRMTLPVTMLSTAIVLFVVICFKNAFAIECAINQVFFDLIVFGGIILVSEFVVALLLNVCFKKSNNERMLHATTPAQNRVYMRQ